MASSVALKFTAISILGHRLFPFLMQSLAYTSFSRLHANEDSLQPSLSVGNPRVALPNSWLVGCTAHGTL